MTHPLRVDQLAADALLLDDLAGRRYAGHDPLGLTLAALAAACDEPIGPATRSRHRRRIGWSTLATGFFLASGVGVAAAVSGALPSVDQGWDRPARIEQPVSPVSDTAHKDPLTALLAPQVLRGPLPEGSVKFADVKFADLFAQVGVPTAAPGSASGQSPTGPTVTISDTDARPDPAPAPGAGELPVSGSSGGSQPAGTPGSGSPAQTPPSTGQPGGQPSGPPPSPATRPSTPSQAPMHPVEGKPPHGVGPPVPSQPARPSPGQSPTPSVPSPSAPSPADQAGHSSARSVTQPGQDARAKGSSAAR